MQPGIQKGGNVVSDLLRELTALPTGTHSQGEKHIYQLEGAGFEDTRNLMPRLQITEPVTERFFDSEEENWKLVSGKAHSPHAASIHDVDEEEEHLEDSSNGVEGMEEGELVEDKSNPSKQVTGKGRRAVGALPQKSAKKTIIITCAIQVPGTVEKFICSAIYAYNTATDRIPLWRDLRATQVAYAHLHLPWILLGDFNVTLATNEHSLKEAWEASPMFYHSRSALSCFHKKLKALKFHLRALNKANYDDLQNRTKHVYDELCECQNKVLLDPCPETFVREAEAAASDSYSLKMHLERRFQ
ncbi:hypothetical protein HID58_022722 [Brassica napus]|uniref:Endonuclease/exonuclease/phosphatase domain-containing protein n=1 Tax=Brassica napus TaxID=3708 RepID=A0ABQ8D025_BRANA|nr:hypothetical protein HID58_022722 [Brassica napus]